MPSKILVAGDILVSKVDVVKFVIFQVSLLQLILHYKKYVLMLH